MIVITGATGHIGSQAAERLLSMGKKVRVIGRRAERLEPLVARGAEAGVGELGDGVFLADAFAGATALFAMIPPNHGAKSFRGFQNEIGAAIAAAIRGAGVTHVVNLSSQGAELSAGSGPILGLRDQEERLNRLAGVNILHLRPAYFMENLEMSIPLIRKMGMTGSAVRGDQPIAMIATCDIAERVAEHLARRDFTGKVVEDLLGPRDLTFREATAIIGRAIGKPGLKYHQFNYTEAELGMLAMGMGRDAARLFIEMSRALNEGKFAVGRPRTDRNTTGTTLEMFAEDFARTFAAARES
ncbi:NmrA family NAD(P)-binding protein [Desulfuromonas carbonis]|uniref:NmrA family NAD(P)-binding protein n=1 Tax=Desulfuromonas sp. DDH964 TaxID=1823759 RepID=UPI00078CBE91|nr:NmrA family NAD(P)-binding protein [Desulfuromonas sp. DDH964]AMV72040.1 NAD(P)H azoreductase [Desulfuromonas sp. DDH964]